MMTAPTAAMEVLLGLWGKARAGMYRIKCTQQWSPKSTTCGHTKKILEFGAQVILQMGPDKMLPRYAYHKPFTVKFPDKYEWQNGFNPDHTQKKRGGGGGWVYRWGLRMGHSCSLGLYATVFQAGLYAIKSCIMENTEKG